MYSLELRAIILLTVGICRLSAMPLLSPLRQMATDLTHFNSFETQHDPTSAATYDNTDPAESEAQPAQPEWHVPTAAETPIAPSHIDGPVPEGPEPQLENIGGEPHTEETSSPFAEEHHVPVSEDENGHETHKNHGQHPTSEEGGDQSSNEHG